MKAFEMVAVLIIYRGQSWVVKEEISCFWQDLNPGSSNP